MKPLRVSLAHSQSLWHINSCVRWSFLKKQPTHLAYSTKRSNHSVRNPEPPASVGVTPIPQHNLNPSQRFFCLTNPLLFHCLGIKTHGVEWTVSEWAVDDIFVVPDIFTLAVWWLLIWVDIWWHCWGHMKQSWTLTKWREYVEVA